MLHFINIYSRHVLKGTNNSLHTMNVGLFANSNTSCREKKLPFPLQDIDRKYVIVMGRTFSAEAKKMLP